MAFDKTMDPGVGEVAGAVDQGAVNSGASLSTGDATGGLGDAAGAGLTATAASGGSPWVGAAAAGVSLFGTILKAREARLAADREAKRRRLEAAILAQERATQRQMDVFRQAQQAEQGGLNSLIGAFSRALV